MTDDLTYKEIRTAKSGEAVPVFNGGSAMYSLYNPARDAEAFAESFYTDGQENARCGFAVVFGIGNGLHITALADKNPDLRVLAVEHSALNIEFLKARIPRAEVFTHPRVTICRLGALAESFLALYIPALHGAARAVFSAGMEKRASARLQSGM
ncbi:MAG: hypothetical protein Pg6C_09220 [Treponemataceae bacterium]|nr:MAG: hypothetical protein Pg6C_09220 [Treponemataceae bacterium]